MFGANKKREKVLILGLGGVGYYLAQRLQLEEYVVTAIEPNAAGLKQADENLDIRLVKGSAMDIDCWRDAAAETMSSVIAVTDNDAVNMMAAQIAEKFGIPNKIARVRSLQFGLEDSLLSSEDLKVDLLIHPEELVSQEIVRLIKLRDANEIIDIAQEQVQLFVARIEDDSLFAHRKLRDISMEYNAFAFRVVAVARGISTIIPSGNMEILPHDQILVMVGSDHLHELMAIAGVSLEKRQRVMILGGGLIGERVAELLQKSVEVRLIEKDEERAEKLSHDLKHVEVLHGDGSKSGILSKAGVQDADIFIAATGDNDTNIMSSLLAKNMILQKRQGHNGGAERTIALVNKVDYQVLAATIGLDIALNGKIMAAHAILKHIRKSELLYVAHIHGFDTEVVELIAAPHSPITKKQLAKLDPVYQGRILIGAVLGEQGWQVAIGSTHIKSNDRVIVICQSMHLKDVRKLFSV